MGPLQYPSEDIDRHRSNSSDGRKQAHCILFFTISVFSAITTLPKSYCDKYVRELKADKERIGPRTFLLHFNGILTAILLHTLLLVKIFKSRGWVHQGCNRRRGNPVRCPLDAIYLHKGERESTSTTFGYLVRRGGTKW